MAKIKLYKNDNLVLEHDGDIQDNNLLVFENIVYDPEKFILIRENDDFKFELDFKCSLAIITLKKEGHSLDLNLSNVKKEIGNESHKIYYNIESEEVISNVLEITF